MKNLEIRITQLGLMGFGREIDVQLDNNAQESVVETLVDTERKKRIRVIPKGLLIYKVNEPDYSYTVLEPFYVLKSEKPKRVSGMEIVRVKSDLAMVYRDGQTVEWLKGMLIEVNGEMIKKK